MDEMLDYNVWKRKKDQQTAAAASSVIQSSDENPDEVAGKLNFAREYSRATGNPVPSLQMVEENRDFFQGRIDRTRNNEILLVSPRLTRWLTENVAAAALAKDDLHNLSSLEKLVQEASQPPQPIPAAISPSTPSNIPTTGPTAVSLAALRPSGAPDTPSPQPSATSSQSNAPTGESTVSAAPIQSASPVPQPVASATATTDAGSEMAVGEDEEKKEALIEKILAAANAHPDVIPVLETEIRTQGWFDAGTGQLALDAVRAGKTTPDEIRTMLGSRYSLATLEKARARATTFAQSVVDGVATGTDHIWGGAKSFGKGVFDATANETNRIWGEAKSFGQGVVDGTASEADRIWGEAKSFGEGVFDAAANETNRIWGEAKSFGQGVVDGTASEADRIWGETKSLSRSIADGAANGSDNIRDGAQLIGQDIGHGAVAATDSILDGTAWLLGETEAPERDALIEEVTRAGSLRSEKEIYELRQKLWKQTWFNPTTAMSVLSGILDGSVTEEDARAQLGGGPAEQQIRQGLEVIRQNGAEVFKGAASAAVTETGRVIEGTGQLLSSPFSKEEQALVGGIANARNLNPAELALLKQQILEHGLFVHPRTANAILGGVLEGKITPDQARERMSPLFSDVFKNIQSYGEQLGDYGEALFPPAPGYENSAGRQLGEMIGSNSIGIATGIVAGPGAGLAVEMLRGAGDGAAAARKAGKTEEEQMVAAMLYSTTAFSDKIPAGKLAGPIIERLTKNPILQQFLKQAVQEGSAQTLQQMLQNLIKHLNLKDEKQKALDKLGDTFRAGGGLGLLKTLLDILLHKRGPDLPSPSIPSAMLQPDGAEMARLTIGEISRYAQASKTRARSYDAFHDFVAATTAGTLANKLFIPSDVFVRHFAATDIDPHELADNHGITHHALQTAQATGGDIGIPTAIYATYFAGTKHDPFLMDNMRFKPGALTVNEAKALREQSDAYRQAGNSEAKRILVYALANHAAEQRIYHQVALRARAAGQPEEVAARYAMTYPALYSTMAAAGGLSLDTYLSSYPLS